MRILLFSIIMIPVLSGCIAIKENKQPIVRDALIIYDQEKKPEVYISFKSSNYKNRTIDKLDANFHADYFKSSLLSSRCCTIAGSKQQADIVIEGIIKPNNNPWIIIPQIISASSLFIIPYWNKMHYETELMVTMVNGKQIKYKLDDSVTTYNWLPLIVLSIFPPIMIHNKKADPHTVSNLYRNFVYKMKRDEALKFQ